MIRYALLIEIKTPIKVSTNLLQLLLLEFLKNGYLIN